MPRRLLLMLVSLVSCLNVAFADQQQTSYIAFGDSGSASNGGIYVPHGMVTGQDLVNPGVLVHSGTLARFVCVELVETQDGLSTMYAAATIVNGHRWHLKVVDIPEGSGSAMVGFADSATSLDRCGAASIVPTHSARTLKVSLPEAN